MVWTKKKRKKKEKKKLRYITGLRCWFAFCVSLWDGDYEDLPTYFCKRKNIKLRSKFDMIYIKREHMWNNKKYGFFFVLNGQFYIHFRAQYYSKYITVYVSCSFVPSLIHTVYIQTYIYLYWHDSLVHVANDCLSPFLSAHSIPPRSSSISFIPSLSPSLSISPLHTGTRDPGRPLPFSLETAMMF